MKTLRISFEEHDSMGMPTILQREIWDSSLEALTRYLPEEKDFFAFLREQTASFRDKSFRVEGESMIFEFDGEFADFAAHTLGLIVAARQETLQKLAEHHDIELALPTLTEALKESQTKDPDFAPHSPAPEDASNKTLTKTPADGDVGAPADAAPCQCPLCRQLRPDPDVEQRWIAALESSDQSAAENASYFVLHSAEPSTDALRALAGAGADLGGYRMRRALFNLGQRLSTDRFSAIRQAIETSRDEDEAAGLLALLAGLDVDAQMRFDALRENFDADSPAGETAVEFLGYGEVPDGRLTDLADELAALVARHDELDYAIAQTLYNLFREVDYPPSVVKSTLRELTGARGEAADVAQRALAWFG